MCLVRNNEDDERRVIPIENYREDHSSRRRRESSIEKIIGSLNCDRYTPLKEKNVH